MNCSKQSGESIPSFHLYGSAGQGKSLRAARSCGRDALDPVTLRCSTCGAASQPPIIRLHPAHWCSRLTRCPLKAETTGSSPVCATSNQKATADSQWLLFLSAPHFAIFTRHVRGQSPMSDYSDAPRLPLVGLMLDPWQPVPRGRQTHSSCLLRLLSTPKPIFCAGL
jgi:hypothetical protein